MNPETRSLIRKEWQERRLALVVCIGWMTCCAVYAIAYERAYEFRAPVATYSSASLIYSLFAAIFLAMKTALGEHTRGTFGFSQSLPGCLRRLAWVKLCGGVMTLACPILLGAAMMTLLLWLGYLQQAPVRPPLDAYVPLPQRSALSATQAVALLWTVTAIASAGGIQLFLILSIIGTRLRTESQVGFCGAVLAFGWMALPELRIQTGVVSGWLGALLPTSLVIHYGYGDTGGGSYSDLDIAQPLWMPLAANLVVLLFLAVWFARWYGTRVLGRRSGRIRVWRRGPAVWSRISIPLPNRITALVWINLRQSLPLAFFGLLLAVALTYLQFSSHGLEQSIRTQLPSSTWIVGAIWAVVVGTGVFSAELQPGLSSFWRSRALTVRSWYWCKFLTGLLAVLIVLDGVTVFVSWGTAIGYTTGLSSSYIACMPIIHAALYAAAVLGVCWTRRPVVGGILAIAAYSVTTILLSSVLGGSLEPIEIHNSLLGDEIAGQLNLTDHNYPLVYGLMVAVAVVCAGMASRVIQQPDGGRVNSRRRELATATRPLPGTATGSQLT